MVTTRGSNETVTRAALFLVLLAALGGVLVVMGRALEMVAQAPAQAAAQVEVETAIQQLGPLTDHAKLKHPESEEIRDWINANMETDLIKGCKWDCGSGDSKQTRYGCKMGSHWIYAVVDATATITAYFTDQDYAVGHTRDWPGCSNPLHPMHP